MSKDNTKEAGSERTVLYQFNWNGRKLEQKEFLKITAQFGLYEEFDWSGEPRRRRESLQGWYKTPDDAIKERRNRLNGNVARSRDNLAAAESELAQFERRYPNTEGCE